MKLIWPFMRHLFDPSVIVWVRSWSLGLCASPKDAPFSLWLRTNSSLAKASKFYFSSVFGVAVHSLLLLWFIFSLPLSSDFSLFSSTGNHSLESLFKACQAITPSLFCPSSTTDSSIFSFPSPQPCFYFAGSHQWKTCLISFLLSNVSSALESFPPSTLDFLFLRAILSPRLLPLIFSDCPGLSLCHLIPQWQKYSPLVFASPVPCWDTHTKWSC